MIQKFRKKSIIVEAIQFTGNNEIEIMDFVGKRLHFSHPPSAYEHDHDIPNELVFLIISTSEGDMACNRYDWVVKEPFDKIRGFYPVKNEVFKLTYENANRAKTEITQEQYNDACKIIYYFRKQKQNKEKETKQKTKITPETYLRDIEQIIPYRLRHPLSIWYSRSKIIGNIQMKHLKNLSIKEFSTYSNIGKLSILELQNFCKRAGVKLKP